MKRLKKVFLFLVVAAAAVLAAAIPLFMVSFSAPENFSEDVLFTVNDGESLASLARRLETEGIIRSALVLRAYSFFRGTEKEFQKGEYQLTAKAGLVEIHDQIVDGRQLLLRVTFPEGWTSSRMALLVEEEEIASAESFLEAVRSRELLEKWRVPSDSLEGFLYPDTYLFPRNAGGEAVVTSMVNHFFEELDAIKPGATRQDPSDWYQLLVLASIVEREYRVAEEAPIISSVFRNRLRWNIPLGSCATVEYIITEIQGKPHPRRIFFSDTEILSPYNTYINRGLPPSPISNPGRVALHAAFYPAETDYLFFVVNNPSLGTHTFTKTMGDHLEAREVYLNNFVPKY